MTTTILMLDNAISFSKDNCDAARALSMLLDALVDANFQEADDGLDADAFWISFSLFRKRSFRES